MCKSPVLYPSRARHAQPCTHASSTTRTRRAQHTDTCSISREPVAHTRRPRARTTTPAHEPRALSSRRITDHDACRGSNPTNSVNPGLRFFVSNPSSAMLYWRLSRIGVRGSRRVAAHRDAMRGARSARDATLARPRHVTGTRPRALSHPARAGRIRLRTGDCNCSCCGCYFQTARCRQRCRQRCCQRRCECPTQRTELGSNGQKHSTPGLATPRFDRGIERGLPWRGLPCHAWRCGIFGGAT